MRATGCISELNSGSPGHRAGIISTIVHTTEKGHPAGVAQRGGRLFSFAMINQSTTAAPIAAPTGPLTAPAAMPLTAPIAAAPTPVSIGCEPGAFESGSALRGPVGGRSSFYSGSVLADISPP